MSTQLVFLAVALHLSICPPAVRCHSNISAAATSPQATPALAWRPPATATPALAWSGGVLPTSALRSVPASPSAVDYQGGASSSGQIRPTPALAFYGRTSTAFWSGGDTDSRYSSRVEWPRSRAPTFPLFFSTFGRRSPPYCSVPSDCLPYPGSFCHIRRCTCPLGTWWTSRFTHCLTMPCNRGGRRCEHFWSKSYCSAQGACQCLPYYFWSTAANDCVWIYGDLLVVCAIIAMFFSYFWIYVRE